MSTQENYDDLDFDPVALREKYRLEREKRLREDGNEQYIEVKDDFSRYLDDPYVAPIKRDPVSDEVDVLVIGGGFGGLLAGARLKEAGIKDVRIVEKGGDFGGTWYWNRYPGAQCDIEAYVYLPLLEELNYVPKEKYSHAPEILAHSSAIGKHYDLYEKALFQTQVTNMQWDEDTARWTVETNKGDKVRARFVAMANGPLDRPKLPGIPGIDTYNGHTFHTSRWDYDYTGGSPEGGLTKLKDKRVAIIGTGATSVQCVPHVGEMAKQLYVFQRTPSGVDVRGNSPTDEKWAASLKPGWQKERMENFNALVSGVPQAEDLVNDGWTDLIGKMLEMFRKGEAGDGTGRSLPEIVELANFEKMNEIRARAEELVNDPNTAEELKPYYAMFCKRPCFHDDYLPTFNRPSVELIDTNGQGVDRITEKGVVVDGKEYEVDCIIFGTGFEVGTDYTRRAGYDIVGKQGQKLSDKWQDGMKTFHGMQSNGFPNCFLMSAQQGGFSANYPHLLNEVAVHLAHIVSHMKANDLIKVEASESAEAAWVEGIISGEGPAMQIGGEGCTPGYYNNEGKPNPKLRYGAFYSGGSIAFWDLLEKWREAGDFDGLEFSS
jgi:cyclohexanone monooxygenase|tara:strand:- start:2217 stop:4025 length:1809 start_codon:yes stop_codon:yes gene_type:complete